MSSVVSPRSWDFPFHRLLEGLPGCPPRPPLQGRGISRLLSDTPPPHRPSGVWLLSWNEYHFPVLTLPSCHPPRHKP